MSNSPLQMEWHWARTPMSCDVIFPMGLPWTLPCTFSHHQHLHTTGSARWWESYFHYSLAMLCSSFLTQALLRAGTLPCPLGYAPEQDSYMWDMWPPEPEEAHQALYLLFCNRKCKIQQWVFTVEGTSWPSPDLKNVYLLLFSASFEVARPWIFIGFVLYLLEHMFLPEVASILAMYLFYWCDGSMWCAAGCPDGPDLFGLY